MMKCAYCNNEAEDINQVCDTCSRVWKKGYEAGKLVRID